MGVSARDDMLVERYGGARRGRRVALLVGLAPVVVAFLAWVVWAAWLHSTPQVDSELVGWEIVDEHTTTVDVEVQIDDGADARCLVQALAADHTPSGSCRGSPSRAATRSRSAPSGGPTRSSWWAARPRTRSGLADRRTHLWNAPRSDDGTAAGLDC